mmetsp:Transcript_27525/g.41895  ORF Transcript_27525/g.41895 Transcript_27525/m.41895 type:complete len:449 (+) Transcript_27525:152-1498(+)
MLRGNPTINPQDYLWDLKHVGDIAREKQEQQELLVVGQGTGSSQYYVTSLETNSRKRKAATSSDLTETNDALPAAMTNTDAAFGNNITEQVVPLREQLIAKGYPLLVQVEVYLNNDSHQQAISIVERMEDVANAAGITAEEQIKGWFLILEYLRHTSQLFLDGNYSMSDEYNKKKKLLQTIFTSMGNVGRNALLQYYKEFVGFVTPSTPNVSSDSNEYQATNEEVNYLTKASQQTILRLLLSKYDIKKSIEYFTETFPDVYIWGRYSNTGNVGNETNDNNSLLDWAIDFLRLNSNPMPSSLINNANVSIAERGTSDYQKPDINILLDRSTTPRTALTTFNNKVAECEAENDAVFEVAMNAVRNNAFSKRAVSKQKRHMRGQLHKTIDISMSDFLTRLFELNGHFQHFPPNVPAAEGDAKDQPEGLLEDDVMDILENEVPRSCQKKMRQ